ncbi:Hypothetical_protein [Hexamita inflata]|uniref:Hypothetical_protein n=1 Tax=Hexamita inflata TaxID=28002 RepID=A0AA86URU8_9EUKA|nr:Hypothetical protein HINF_LOCUS49801 [Hexamita inflata]
MYVDIYYKLQHTYFLIGYIFGNTTFKDDTVVLVTVQNPFSNQPAQKEHVQKEFKTIDDSLSISYNIQNDQTLEISQIKTEIKKPDPKPVEAKPAPKPAAPAEKPKQQPVKQQAPPAKKKSFDPLAVDDKPAKAPAKKGFNLDIDLGIDEPISVEKPKSTKAADKKFDAKDVAGLFDW